MKTIVLIILLFCISMTKLIAQINAPTIMNDSKFRIGIKGMYEKSEGGIEPNYVFNYGLQAIYKVGKKWSSIESGVFIYRRTQAIVFSGGINYDVYVNYEIINLHLPIRYMYSRKFIYLTTGIYGEYLLEREIKQPPNTINIGFPDNRKYTWGFVSSIGIKKMVIKGIINFFTELVASGNISPLYQSGSGVMSSLNYGIAFGVNFKI
jgi:hypothetical protein